MSYWGTLKHIASENTTHRIKTLCCGSVTLSIGDWITSRLFPKKYKVIPPL